MNQLSSVEEHSQHGLDIGLHQPRFLQLRRWCRVPLGGHLLCFQVTLVNPTVITRDYRGHEFGIVLGSMMEVSAYWHAIVLLLRRQETGHKFRCHTSHLQIFSSNFLARTECYSNFLWNLYDRCQSARIISRTRAMVSSVWEVDGLPGRGSSSKDWRPLLKWEYHSDVFDWLRQDSPKAACSILYVSAPVFCRLKSEIKAHTLLHFPFHREMRRTLQVDVHWKTSKRMRGDTDHRFCAYTCTELIHFALCCHFATYYSFEGKKISPGIKWSAHVLFRIAMFMDLVSDCADEEWQHCYRWSSKS